ILAGSHPRPHVSNAEKLTADAKRASNKENTNALSAEIMEFFDFRDSEITWLTKKYNKNNGNIKQLLSNESSYQNTCVPSLRNALVHAKGTYAGAGISGGRLKLVDLQKLVDDDPSMQRLSKDQQQQYIADLKLHRETTRIGIHTSNAAAMTDCRASVGRMSTEIRNLSEGTGVCVLVFFMHTHIHDSTLPSWADLDDAIGFVSEVLKLEPMEFLTRFEQWVCARTKSEYCALITDKIMLMMGAILNLKNIGMSYMKYKQDIVVKYKVELCRWPTMIKFANPSEIGTVNDICKLRQALQAGECKWVAQSRRQQEAYAEKLTGKEASGETVVRKRKERLDKGKTQNKGGKKSTMGKKGVKCGMDDEEDIGEEEEDGVNSNKGQEHREPARRSESMLLRHMWGICGKCCT
ncbi:hypothetical protein L208DRAFT_1244996, partial [Tricholoma matsutake]